MKFDNDSTKYIFDLIDKAIIDNNLIDEKNINLKHFKRHFSESMINTYMYVIIDFVYKNNNIIFINNYDNCKPIFGEGYGQITFNIKNELRKYTINKILNEW
jgi:hypothetical protein